MTFIQSMEKQTQYQILDQYAIVRVTGSDSSKLLQGQLTCDVNQADGQTTILGGYCNVQGRLHATFYLLQTSPEPIQYWLVMPKEVAEHFVSNLAKYAVFFQVDISIEQNLLLLAANNSPKLKHFSQASLEDYGQQFILGKLTVSALNPDHWEQFKQAHLSGYAVTKTDLLALEQVRNSIPMVLASTIESLLPHYTGLTENNGVSFDKGCYTGQEVVARMHYRGSLKIHPHQAFIESDSVIEAGTDITNQNQRKVGTLINCALGQNGLEALISLKDNASAEPLSINDSAIKLTV